MKNKKYLLLLVVVFCSLVTKAYALTIRETMDSNDGHSTLEEGSVIIGATRFSPDTIVTASKAATAGVNDAMLHVLKTGTTEGYKTPGVYYYVDSYVGWFYLDSENNVTTVTEPDELERLSKLDIYYVDNIEKVLEIDYSNNDIKEDTLPKGVTYKDNKLYVNATVGKVEFRTLDEKKISFILDSTTSKFIEDIRNCYTVNNNTITDYDPDCGNNLVIPTEINGVTITSIATNAFKNTNLVNVTIPNTITSIGNNAFANNKLEKVIIKDKYNETDFSNYGDNVFGEFTNITYDNILTKMLTYIDSDYIINYYKTFDINNIFINNIDEEYFLTGYIIERLTTTLENNGYNKDYRNCGEDCSYYEEMEEEIKKIYGISYERTDDLKYRFTIQNYDNNKINKVSKNINISFNETGKKDDSETVIEAKNNLELDHRFDRILGADSRSARRKSLQDIEDIYQIEIITNQMGGGTLDWDNFEMLTSFGSCNVYYIKNNVIYNHEVLNIASIFNTYTPKEIVNDYDDIDSYIEYILDRFTKLSGVTNYEIKVNEDGSIYKEAPGIDNYETAKTYHIKLFDKEYLEEWDIQFHDFYEDKYDENGYTLEECFEISDGIITDYDGTCGINVVIPNTINGMDVLEIGNDVFNYMKLKSVKLPNTLKKIGDNAFYFNQLTSIELPNTLTHIGSSAFSHNQLVSIELPNTITNIGSSAFYYNKITNINIPNSIEEISIGAFSENEIETINLGNNIKKIESSAFINNNIKQLILPEGIEEIGSDAFSNNKIQELELPNSLKILGTNAFINNQLPDENAFIYNRKYDAQNQIYIWDYESLNSYAGANRENVIIPNNIKVIGQNAFRYCSIKKVKLPESIKEIGYDAFAYNKLTSIDIPYGINTIRDWAFAWNELTFVVVPDSIEYLGCYVFEENKFEGDNSFIYTKDENNKIDYTTLAGYYNTSYSVDELVIPSTVKKILKNAFGQVDINKLVIPYGVEEIGSNAFLLAPIKELSIPKSVTKIGENAFSGHYTLSEEDGYVYATNEDGTIDKSILMAYIGNFEDGSLTIPEGVEEIRENVFYSIYSLKEVILPSTLKKIGNNAFYLNFNLTNVIFNDKLEFIGDNAFYNNHLSTLTLGDNIKYIGENAFTNNYYLESVTIGNGPTEIGNNAFQYNQNLVSLTLGNNIKSIGAFAFANSELTEVNIPGTVKTIGEYAFAWNNLSKITLNEGIEKIDKSAFGGDNKLKEVTLPSSVTYLGSTVFNVDLEKVTVLGKSSKDEFTNYGYNPFGYNAIIIYELFEPSLELPTLPLNIYSYDESFGNRNIEITEIKYSFKENEDKTYDLTILLSGNKTHDDMGNEHIQSAYANFYLYNGETSVVTGTYYLPEVKVGDNFTDYKITFNNLPREYLSLSINSY